MKDWDVKSICRLLKQFHLRATLCMNHSAAQAWNLIGFYHTDWLWQRIICPHQDGRMGDNWIPRMQLQTAVPIENPAFKRQTRFTPIGQHEKLQIAINHTAMTRASFLQNRRYWNLEICWENIEKWPPSPGEARSMINHTHFFTCGTELTTTDMINVLKFYLRRNCESRKSTTESNSERHWSVTRAFDVHIQPWSPLQEMAMTRCRRSSVLFWLLDSRQEATVGAQQLRIHHFWINIRREPYWLGV